MAAQLYVVDGESNAEGGGWQALTQKILEQPVEIPVHILVVSADKDDTQEAQKSSRLTVLHHEAEEDEVAQLQIALTAFAHAVLGYWRDLEQTLIEGNTSIRLTLPFEKRPLADDTRLLGSARKKAAGRQLKLQADALLLQGRPTPADER